MTYWDPMPTVAASAGLEVANLPERLLGAPEAYLRGLWEHRDWRNVPGPFYGAWTDSCWVGREVAPMNVVYEDDFGGEVVYRQPENAAEVRLVLTAAWSDPYRSYAADGDAHWTPALVREWWAARGRLAAWIDGLEGRWAVSERADEREAAGGLRDFRRYLGGGLEAQLRGYAFWLERRRAPEPGEALPLLR
ncbi:ferredoxin [Catenuloplanes japonicus]|uniref:ferredoxin n=1 Tax=Catenuloplanes japonicus TaxID=33876 RepID=UPI0018DE567E|nr:ferredoxin [Catenuloplanes japonicus]